MGSPSTISAPDRSAVVAGLVEQLTARIQAGEQVELQSFLDEHAEYADELCGLLPAMSLLVNLSRSCERRGVSPTCDNSGEPLGELGDFRIIREVGRGGMGVVYEAEQISLGRRVALKVLPFAATMDSRHLQRFKNEAKAAGSLKHEHIVHVYGVGCERGVHYYAMEFVDGQTVAQVIGERGRVSAPSLETRELGALTQPRSPDTAPIAALSTKRDKTRYRAIATLIADAADALEHAHSLGIVHRDVKPGNLLLDNSGKIYVSDFGLARMASPGCEAGGLTMSGDLLGTLRYMAPEQALAKHDLADHRVDVYGLGCTLYELLTGKPAVRGEDKAEILKRIAFEEPVPPRKIDKSIPAELETIALKCLAKEPGERYASAGELAADLRRWLDDKPIKAKPPGLREKVAKWGRRHAGLVTSASIMLLLTAIGAGIAAFVVDRQKQRAEIALHDSQQANARSRLILDELFFGEIGDWLNTHVELSPKQKKFVDRTFEHYQWLADRPSNDLETRIGAAGAHLVIGDIHASRGDRERATNAYTRSIELLRVLIAECPDRAECRRSLGAALHNQANQMSDPPPALRPLYLEAVEQQKAAVELNPADEKSREFLLNHLRAVAKTFADMGQTDDWERTTRDMLATAERAVADFPANAELRAKLGEAWSLLSRVCGSRGLTEKSVEHGREAIAVLEKLIADGTNKGRHLELLMDTYRITGMGLLVLRQPEDGRTLFRRALASAQNYVVHFPASSTGWDAMTGFRQHLIGALAEKREFADAEALCRTCISAAQQARARMPDGGAAMRYRLGQVVHDLAWVLKQKGDQAGALKTIDDAIAIQEAFLKSSPEHKDARTFLGQHYTFKSIALLDANPAAAVEAAKKAVAIDPNQGTAQLNLGLASHRLNDWKTAAPSLEKAAKLLAGPDQGWAARHAVLAYLELGDIAAAERNYKAFEEWGNTQPAWNLAFSVQRADLAQRLAQKRKPGKE